MNDPSTGIDLLTTSVVLVELASNNAVAGCDAVMIVVPADTSVMSPVVAFTVATAVLLEEYVNGAVFVDDGGVTAGTELLTDTGDSEKAP